MTLEQQEKRKQIYRKMKELMFLLNHKGIEALKEFSEVQHAENKRDDSSDEFKQKYKRRSVYERKEKCSE